MKTRAVLTLMLIAAVTAALFFVYKRGSSPMFTPPKKIPVKHELHGDVRVDDYFWMKERDSEPVLAFLRQENERTKEALKPVAKLEDKLYREMRARVKENESSVPQKIDDWWYYTRYETGQEYAIHCR